MSQTPDLQPTNDHRVVAAAEGLYGDQQLSPSDSKELNDQLRTALDAADAADLKHGIARVSVGREAEDRVALILWDDAMSHMDSDWREMAWNDMGGSEPSNERVQYEDLAASIIEALKVGG